MEYQYDTIEKALEDLRAGKIILVTDDPDLENEGDMICAAEFATQKNINFMASQAKGLICTPMSIEIAQKLGFPPMVSENTDNHETAFTVSIDHVETTTGISAKERSFTMMKCTDPASKPEDFRRPGHVFPLIARRGGVLVRNGHTEATVDLLRLAGLTQCGVCCEIMDEDGTRMQTPKLWELAKKYDIEMEIIDPGVPSGLADIQGSAFRLAEKALSEVFPDVVPAPYIMTSPSHLTCKRPKTGLGLPTP